MAIRGGRRRGADEFYVYRIFEEHQTLYVGKGCRDRLAQQQRRFRCNGEIIEKCTSEAHSFEREKFWIAELHPTENKNAGGGGMWSFKRKKREPVLEIMKEYEMIKRVGTRRFAARILLRVAQVRPDLIDLDTLPELQRVAA